MLKHLVFVVFCNLFFLETECLYSGDSCTAEHDQLGTCVALSSCQPLKDEVRRAGNPMPYNMRRKLQSLGCGFEESEPIVCCTQADKNNEAKSYEEYGNFKPNTVTPDSSGDDTYTEDPFNRGFNNQNNEVNNRYPTDISQHPNLRLLPTECGEIEDDRIWGGQRTQLYEMPWMVLLSYQDVTLGPRLSCGGTLINKWYVLTAAHCIEFLPTRLILDGAILGEYDVRTNPDCDDATHCAPPIRNMTIDRVIPHPGYTPETRNDDIALVRLSEPADFRLSTMKPICLPLTKELQTESLENKRVVIAGWGVTEEGIQSPVLMSVALPVVPKKECEKDYAGLVQLTDGQMCAGGEDNKDSCSGDSGGPLMYPGRVGGKTQYVQRGIVSYGTKRCALGGYPAIYTKVAPYMEWILDNIQS